MQFIPFTNIRIHLKGGMSVAVENVPDLERNVCMDRKQETRGGRARERTLVFVRFFSATTASIFRVWVAEE